MSGVSAIYFEVIVIRLELISLNMICASTDHLVTGFSS